MIFFIEYCLSSNIAQLYNKGVAFPYSERDRFHLRGLLWVSSFGILVLTAFRPPVVNTLEVHSFVLIYRGNQHCNEQEQVQRTKSRIQDNDSDIRKYLFLSSLQDRNETLFYKLLMSNIKEYGTFLLQLRKTYLELSSNNLHSNCGPNLSGYISLTVSVVPMLLQEFGYLYRRPRGMYVSAVDKGEIASMMYNWPGSFLFLLQLSFWLL